MNFEKFTQAAKQVLNNSMLLAQSEKHQYVAPLHTLSAGLDHTFCQTIFNELSLDTTALHHLVNQELEALPISTGTQLAADRTFQEFMAAVQQEADLNKRPYIGLADLMIHWAEGTGLPQKIGQFFKDAGVTTQALREHMKEFSQKKGAEQNPEEQYKILERYCQNLTQAAREGKLDPVIGRHEEIRRVIQILSRRTKNNPVLIGEPGVGKTAIVEGIAQRIVNNDVPETLKNNIIYALDLGLLIAGAKFQGEFEERLKGVLKAIEESKTPIILFIDELHLLVGAGQTQGAMDASNLLKPALARGILHCIGATTYAEYKKYIESDAALERRFQKVTVNEPSVEDTISILRGLKEKYELHHGIRIKDSALQDAAQLADRTISDRFLPDKAIDLVDEAAAMVKMVIDSKPEHLDKVERKIRQLEIEKVALEKEKSPEASSRLETLEKELANLKEEYQQAVTQWEAEKRPLEKITLLKEQIDQAQHQFAAAEREGNFARASEIKYGILVNLEKELAEEQKKLKELKTHLIKEEVDEDDIRKVLSRWTGIPVQKLQTSQTERLLNMREVLKKRVVGQDEAIDTITNAIQVHRAGLADPNRPIGSFLFLGPTGVGKTEVAKSLADFLFDDERHMIRIDMSEYMEKHAVARLIGAPPGYVGYQEGGQLTEAVRKHPYSVILFDEIEKAHPDVFNIFLQILDEGHLTDSQGRTVSFKNTIIIMTSNIGSYLMLAADDITDQVKEKVHTLLLKHFRPEFLNRVDAVVFFNPLSAEDIIGITEREVQKLINSLKEKGISLVVNHAVYDYISKIGYSREFGARPIKRTIHHYVIVPLAQYLLAHPDAQVVRVDMEKEKIKLS